MSRKTNRRTVKAIRDVLGLTQKELAQRIGVTTTTLARWERGDKPITKPSEKLLLTFISEEQAKKILAS